MNEEIKGVAEKIVKEEKTIEREMKELFGNEVEGSTLFNVYSQMKRVGGGESVRGSCSIR